MTDTITSLPAAGWYPDPTSSAPFRWWNGAGWTADVLQDAPPAPASPVPVVETVAAHPTPEVEASPTAAPALATPAAATPAAEPRAVRAADGSLPSRRSLRAAAQEGATSPASPPAVVDAPAAPVAGVDGPATPKAGADGSAESPRPSAPYVPLNPLAASVASPASPVSPVDSKDRGFTAPAAWLANAPALPHVPGQPVYGQPISGRQRVSGPQQPYGYAGSPGQNGYGPGGTAAVATFRSDGVRPKNTPAYLSLLFPLLALVGFPVATGVLAGAGVLGTRFGVVLVALIALVATGMIVAGIPLGIVGLVRASRLVRTGFTSKTGRFRAVAGLILCALMLVAGTLSAAGGAEKRLTDGQTSAGLPAAGTSQVGTGTSAGSGFAGAPRMAVPSASGDGTYTYSQAQAQNAISASYVATLKVTPSAVACPAAEPIVVSENFTCTVTVPGGAVTTATVTIVDAQGHAEVDVH